MTAEQRLDTVEVDLEAVKQMLASAARYAESANQKIDRLSDRVDDLTTAQANTLARIDDLTTAQANTLARIDDLIAAQDRTQTQLDRLGSKIDQLAESQAQTQVQLNQLVESQAQAFIRLDRIDRALDTLASNQVAEREARLALREDLEILYQGVQLSEENTERTLNRLAESQRATDAAINNLSGRDDLLAAHLSQLTLTVNRLAESQQATEVALNNLARLVVRSVETAEADRAVIRENQAEIRRIWEYLLHQSGNGSSGYTNE